MNRVTYRVIIAAAVLALSFAAVAASALTFGDLPITTWVGTGSNQSAMVVDFGPKSFTFGYNWSGTATGADMMAAIANATGLTYETAYGGTFVNDIRYQGYSGANPGWTAYWASTDGQNWTNPSVGFTDRTLSNGSWDGWTWGSPTAGWPGNAPNPVPEPTSLVALALGLGTVIIRRKRS